MRQANLVPVWFISAERPEHPPAVNGYLTMQLEAALRGLSYQKVRGCYEGREEAAFMVLATGPDVEHYLSVLGHKLGQDSLLYLDNERQAHLVLRKTGARVPIGKWTEVSQHEARESHAWTRTADGRYWVVK